MRENESNPRRCVNGVVTYRDRRGRLHREDGPAVERPDGTRFWYRNSRLHREDGPAHERADGSKVWYLYDIKLPNEAQFETAVELLNRDREVEHARTKACNDGDFHILEGGRYGGLYHFESGSMVLSQTPWVAGSRYYLYGKKLSHDPYIRALAILRRSRKYEKRHEHKEQEAHEEPREENMDEEVLRRREQQLQKRFEEIDKRERRVSVLEEHTQQYEEDLRRQRDQLAAQKEDLVRRSRELNLRETELDAQEFDDEVEEEYDEGFEQELLRSYSKQQIAEEFAKMKKQKEATHMSHIKKIGSDIGNAVAEGGKLVLADQFNEMLVDLMKTAAIKGGVAPEILELDAVHTAMKFFAPLMMKVATDYAPDMIPGSQMISAASTKAIEMTTIQTILPMINELRPKFAEMAAVAKKLEGSYEGADAAPEGTPSVAARQNDDVFERMTEVNQAEKVTA